MKIPGVIYSLILAVAAWAIDYLTTGQGAGIPWGPIVIAAIPVLLKLVEPEPAPPEPSLLPRSMAYDGDDTVTEQPSKTRRILLG